MPNDPYADIPWEDADQGWEDVPSSKAPFPGMPQGLRGGAPDFSTFSKPESSFADLAGESIPEVPPPPMLRRPEAPLFPDRTGNIFTDAVPAGEMTPSATNLEDAGANLATGAGVLAAGGGAAALGLARAGGAVQGGQLGYKKFGVPGAVAGGVAGAIAPGMATVADLGEMAGGDAGGIGAVGLAAAIKKFGPSVAAKFLGVPEAAIPALLKAYELVRAEGTAARAATAAKNIPAEVEAAVTAGKVSQAVPGRIPSSVIQEAEALAAKNAGKANVAEDVAAAVKQAEVDKALQASRTARGAERVGKTVGKTTEQVRSEAGPVLDEALGEASPIMPRQALQSIVDTMRKMPMAEREAYVARATSGKAKWQVENIRRTLEHLGLLLPVGIAGGLAASQGE
jgi:hypothetical protein